MPVHLSLTGVRMCLFKHYTSFFIQGVAFGISRLKCDQIFLDNMRRQCNSEFADDLKVCLVRSCLYTFGPQLMSHLCFCIRILKVVEANSTFLHNILVYWFWNVIAAMARLLYPPYPVLSKIQVNIRVSSGKIFIPQETCRALNDNPFFFFFMQGRANTMYRVSRALGIFYYYWKPAGDYCNDLWVNDCLSLNYFMLI